MGLVADFVTRVRNVQKTGSATEHSYRPAIEALLNGLDKSLAAINEPKRERCGAPDFIIQRDNIAVGHVEAKDLHIRLEKLNEANAEQKQRYLKALPNLLYTNCLDWEFYRDGELYTKITIAHLDKVVQGQPANYAHLEHILRDFVAQSPRTITSSKDLAEKMAGKSALLKDVFYKILAHESERESEIYSQYSAFKTHLIHDISVAEFADIYAETIAYGMFAARLHDKSLENFSRSEALDLLPRSNPFLRSLFSYIAGPDLDDRVRWIVDDLASVFLAADMARVMENFGKLTGQTDPFLHFYETFLSAYNPKKRKSRGVWYTPEAVVNFIVRGVDQILIEKFSLPDGLADNSKVNIDWDTGQKNTKGRPIYTKKDVHKVQILDPATGTGTFLAEVVKNVAPRVKDVAEAAWSNYVARDLIPRLHGFELLMASYAMCHTKLDMILGDLGYEPRVNAPRLSVYLTNSLEEGEPANQTLPFAQWLSNEAKQANAIKRDMPIMCVIGNPPYSIKSGNLASDQVSLIDPYRFVDGKRIKEKGMLQFEININNDYIKFIALSEKLIRKNKFGILAFITSHGYLKSESFRGLRQHLTQTFDEIRIIDLHGNTEVREVVPGGITDKNVFDIKQGVSIILAYRTQSKDSKSTGRVFYSELWGTRQYKYDKLHESGLDDFEWKDCDPSTPNYTFHPSGAESGKYESSYFSITDLMPVYSSGVITARDDFSIAESDQVLVERARAFSGDEKLPNDEFCEKIGIALKKGWDVTKARTRMRSFDDPKDLIQEISYRPFDNRKILFDESVVWTTARSTMDHMLRGDNYALVTARSEKSGTCSHFYVSKHLVETKCGERTTQSAVFPLYLYPPEGDLEKARRINFNDKVHKKIVKLVSAGGGKEPSELDIFDYMYGIFHAPAYREKYAEFLKRGFPRIPWPSPKTFWEISEKGRRLRKVHLLETAALGKIAFPLVGKGHALVEKTRFEDDQVWINESQYFDGVPQSAWDHFLGGYQPAQKWLKDRKGRELSFEEIKHYQRILKALVETKSVMDELKPQL